MKLTTIIVDDEPLGRRRMRTLLAREKDLEILAECADGPSALEAIRRQPPHVLFLDVQMPEMDGFEVLRQAGSPLPLVVFVTAFDEHAVSAFEIHALDYLLKPFKADRLHQAVARARAQLAVNNGEDPARRLLSLLENRMSDRNFLSRIVVRERERTRFVRVSDIDWIEAASNYVVLHSNRTDYVVRETLAAIEMRLSPREFFRLNRSAIVRLDRVQQIEPVFEDEHVVVLENNVRLPLTRSVCELRERLSYA